MQGLDHANRLMDVHERESFIQELQQSREKRLLADENEQLVPK